jgi:ribose-phosphate pyrophosphokinase
MLILGFDDYRQPAQALADSLQVDYRDVVIHVFPDGESKITLPARLPDTVVFVRTLDHPNAKMLELLIAAGAARSNGASKVLLVAPYLCYMRQDIAFQPGEAVSQKIVGALLADHFDAVITVDPHLHRISQLSEAIPKGQAIALSAASLMGHTLRMDTSLSTPSRRLLLVGPDEESEQWVKHVAAPAGLDYVIAQKVRHGDRHVDITLPDRDYEGIAALLVDDVISSGHTLKQCAQQLFTHGCASVSAMCTHPLLAPGAMEALNEAGIRELISTDAIVHASNRIPLAGMLADALRSLVA